MATIVTKKVDELTASEYRTLYNLNFRKSGSMQYELKWAKQRYPNNTDVVIMKEKDEIVSWALVFPFTNDRRFKRTAYFYTKKPYRNKGYGSRVMDVVQKIERKPKVCPHDPPSKAFFNKFNGKVIK